MDRGILLKKIVATDWDIVIVGRGATGLGCAVDAASRGYQTLLLEQVDFSKGKGTCSG
jgi:glycerol-3-phosphate dehydrogenase